MKSFMLREAIVHYKTCSHELEDQVIRTRADVVSIVRKVVECSAREHFVVLLLNTRHRLIGWQVVAIGTASAALIHPREVFQTAVHLGASAMIVAHTHPSGVPDPSSEDLFLTQRLRQAGRVLGIEVEDHVIVTTSSSSSLRTTTHWKDMKVEVPGS